MLTGAFCAYEVFYPEGDVMFLVVMNMRSVRSCALPSKPVGATFALQPANQHATTLCDDLRFNVCGTVVRGATGSLDLLDYFTMCLYAAWPTWASSYFLAANPQNKKLHKPRTRLTSESIIVEPSKLKT